MSTKNDVFNYVMKTPENTNPAVLKDLLNGIGGGSGGSNRAVLSVYYDLNVGDLQYNLTINDAPYGYPTRSALQSIIDDKIPLFIQSENVFGSEVLVSASLAKCLFVEEAIVEYYCIAGYWSSMRGKSDGSGYSIEPVGVSIAFTMIDEQEEGSATYKTFKVSYQEVDPMDPWG